MPMNRLTLLQRWEVLSPAHTGTVKTSSGLSDNDLETLKNTMKGQGGNIMFSSNQKTEWENFTQESRDNDVGINVHLMSTAL